MNETLQEAKSKRGTYKTAYQSMGVQVMELEEKRTESFKLWMEAEQALSVQMVKEEIEKLTK